MKPGMKNGKRYSNVKNGKDFHNRKYFGIKMSFHAERYEIERNAAGKG